jgi:hypothetical protein
MDKKTKLHKTNQETQKLSIMTKKNKKILSIITLNVKDLSDYTKRHSTFLSLWLHLADIILLQEINWWWSFGIWKKMKKYNLTLQILFIQSQWLLSSYWNYYIAILVNNKNIIVNKFQEFYKEYCYCFLDNYRESNKR